MSKKPSAKPRFKVRSSRIVSRQHRYKTLVSVWSHPNSGQLLVIPGRKKKTRGIAIDHFGDDPKLAKKMTCTEEWWGNRKLKSLPEYDG